MQCNMQMTQATDVYTTVYTIKIYGNESYTARLKLISVLNGISQMDKIMEEVTHFV